MELKAAVSSVLTVVGPLQEETLRAAASLQNRRLKDVTTQSKVQRRQVYVQSSAQSTSPVR